MDAKFELGRVVITKGAAERLENDDEFFNTFWSKIMGETRVLDR